jgi:hypothetical protein
MEGATFVELANRAQARAVELRNAAPGPAAREFALAITALEDAQMRFTRGMAMVKGRFAPADLERDDA